METRLRARLHDASDASPEVLAQQLRHDPGPMDWVRIDAGSGLDDTLSAARRALTLSSLPQIGQHRGPLCSASDRPALAALPAWTVRQAAIVIVAAHVGEPIAKKTASSFVRNASVGLRPG